MSRARQNRRAAAHRRAGRLTGRQAMAPSTGRRGKVSYAGSAAGGYSSEWAAPMNVGGAIKPVVIDRRWSETVREQ